MARLKWMLMNIKSPKQREITFKSLHKYISNLPIIFTERRNLTTDTAIFSREVLYEAILNEAEVLNECVTSLDPFRRRFHALKHRQSKRLN